MNPAPPRRAGTLFLIAATVLGLLLSVEACQKAAPSRSAAPAFSRQRGICYEYTWPPRAGMGYGTPASDSSLIHLKRLGVNWISITPFGFMKTPQDTLIRWNAERIYENDSSLAAVTGQAHALGLHVMLKPHLWLRPPAWVGLIGMSSDEQWASWFRAYRAFILHYAVLAEQVKSEALVIGNELEKTSSREEEWRTVIDSVRRMYHGLVTYGAGREEVFTVGFWDALDFIGVSGYYSLVDARTPDVPSLVAAWKPITERLGTLAGRWNRNIVFTELGYRSADFGAWNQWEVARDAPVNLEVQANAYSAFFHAVWDQPWCGGVFWWKWPSSNEGGGPRDNDYTPLAKPSEDTLRVYYSR